MSISGNIRQFVTLTVVLLLGTISGLTYAQNHSGFSLISSSSTHVVLRFNGEDFHFENRMTSRGEAQTIITKNGVQGLAKESPGLPHYAVSLMLPEGSKMIVKIIFTHFYDKKDILISPSKGNVYRGVQQDTLPFVFGKAYGEDAFFPDRLWSARPPYLLRQKYGQTLVVYPFLYNPEKKILRIYDNVVFDITFQKNPKVIPALQKPISTAGFEDVFRHHFLNYPSRLKLVKKQHPAPGMLIISYGPFIPLLKDFITWKRHTGMHVEVVDVAIIGKNRQAIKAYIRKIYQRAGISYVLLVGDAAQVPGGRIAGNDSDNDYAYVDGNDHYPDLFIGRFSAETSRQLLTMVDRTMAYEINPSSGNWYTRAIGIGSEMGPGYRDLMDYQQIRFVDSAYLLTTTYRYATELFDGSQGGADANGDPAAAMLRTAINRGGGIINYCGHGSTAGWSTTHFDNSQVSKLENNDKWPFIISVSCATGNFVHQECFAESWLRASYSGKPTGAVAVLMPAIDQSWDPPMYAQQQMNALLVAPDSVHPPRTFAAICMDGCMKMNDAYGTAGYEITDTWIVFGDPSLEVRTDIPKDIEADYSVSVDDTCSSILVKTNLHNGRVALFSKGIIYAVANVDSVGNALLPVDSIPSGKQADLTITAFNYRPFSGKILWEGSSDMEMNRKDTFGFKVFPNPAKSKISFSFVLKKRQKIEVNIFNLAGKKIVTLFSGEPASGEHILHWKSDAPGIYLVQLKSTKNSIEKKIIFLK